MEQVIQVLTITIDVLIISFLLLLITLVVKMLRTVKALSGFIDNLSDLKFWFSLLKSIPTAFHKSSKKE